MFIIAQIAMFETGSSWMLRLQRILTIELGKALAQLK